MNADRRGHVPNALLVLLILYGAASLLHHVHNAEFLADYPNLPAWLTRAKVYAAWLVAAAVGVAGYELLRRGYRFIGLAVIAAYAAWGFDGLGHYALAPLSQHTVMMNATIWLEVATAAPLLVVAARLLARRSRQLLSPGNTRAER